MKRKRSDRLKRKKNKSEKGWNRIREKEKGNSEEYKNNEQIK